MALLSGAQQCLMSELSHNHPGRTPLDDKNIQQSNLDTLENHVQVFQDRSQNLAAYCLEVCPQDGAAPKPPFSKAWSASQQTG